YVRGNVITGRDCVIGHATEVKNSVLLGNSKAGHFAYIGDSILGAVNLGAGTKLANLKITGTEIIITRDGKKYPAGLRKFGAILGDGVQTGCNSVTMPGTIISKETMLYPNTTARGFYGPGTIIKLNQNIEKGKLK
ncbi:MAG: glucose-1-phosphate thymidylyltransferase, partial [Elusimicrobiota bacterium]|nr:glucose-1-phosphate thymidylyltransferase [Elusimicrobiota bacterium]